MRLTHPITQHTSTEPLAGEPRAHDGRSVHVIHQWPGDCQLLVWFTDLFVYFSYCHLTEDANLQGTRGSYISELPTGKVGTHYFYMPASGMADWFPKYFANGETIILWHFLLCSTFLYGLWSAPEAQLQWWRWAFTVLLAHNKYCPTFLNMIALSHLLLRTTWRCAGTQWLL